jgi:mono/diheme cytochrome c family protein
MRKTYVWMTAVATLAAAITLLFPGSPLRADDASAATYKQKCAACHGPDGKGATPTGKALNVRSFADPDVAKMSDQDMADIIEKGKGKMPKYGASMKADEIKAMVAYLRTLAK